MASAQKTKDVTPFSHRFIAGGIAGTSEILIMYPLDVIKTRAQLKVGQGESMFTIFGQMLKNDGIKMYRGIVPPILIEAPKRAIKFSANATYKQYVPNNQLGAIEAGVGAGITEAFVVVPFELVKIRLQAKENKELYKNTLDAVFKIIKNEGPFALFKGLESTLWRHAFWNGGYFGVIFQVRSIIPKAKSKSGEILNDFIAGTLAGTFGTILNTPADVVKSRIQNQDAKLKPGQPRKYNWAIPSMITVFREEGFTALYKGFLPKVLRLGPGGGILLVVFEVVTKFLKKLENPKKQ